MGIKNIHKLLKKYVPNIYEEVHLSYYAYKKVAIDISLYMFKYKAIFGTKWMSSFLTLIGCLRKYEIHCIFIFDGKAPEEKKKEQDSRKEQRDKLLTKIDTIETDLNTYKTTGAITPFLKEFHDKIEHEKPMRLLGRSNASKLNVSAIENELEKIRSYNIGITKQDVESIKQLFDVLSVPYLVAPGEAECYASQLCLNGLVDMVLSEDTDVMVYGTPIFLTKINSSTGMVTEIHMENVLNSLEMTQEEYVDLCILCGSDYNDTIRGVGPETALKLIKEFGTVDKFPSTMDTSILNIERMRQMFEKQTISIPIPYCGTPDYKKLEEFMFVHNIRMDIQYLKQCFKSPEIIFED
jgi:flap endonuclease-1